MPDNVIQKYHLHSDEPQQLQFEIFPLREYLAHYASDTRRAHTHSFYQIIWFTEGNGEHFIDFGRYDVCPDRIFFIDKGQIHHFDDNRYDGFIVHFNESFIADDENYINIFLRHNIFDVFFSKHFLQPSPDASSELRHIVRRMQDEANRPDAFAHGEYLKTLLRLFLIIVQRIILDDSSVRLLMNNPRHILFMKFRQEVENHFRSLHTVGDYARLLHVSAKTLTNCTNEIVRTTPLTVINERLSLEARRLLLHSDRNISEIAFVLGFDEPSYFIRFFRRLNRVSPAEFRRKVS